MVCGEGPSFQYRSRGAVPQRSRGATPASQPPDRDAVAGLHAVDARVEDSLAIGARQSQEIAAAGVRNELDAGRSPMTGEEQPLGVVALPGEVGGRRFEA